MSQISRSSKMTNYSLAGSQLRPFERILVSGNVDMPEATQDGPDRVSYRAPQQTGSSRFALPLPWTLLLIMVTVAIMAGMTISKARAVKDLELDFAQLHNKYTAAELERQQLQEALSQASDASYICYYAAQNLGMKLALNEETIQLSAPSTRPQALYGDMSQAREFARN